MALFPDTRASVVAALASDDARRREAATDLTVRAYRAPIVAVLRLQWQLDIADAEDLAHDFLAQALSKQWLARFNPAKGRFRTFLRSCLSAFASTAHEAATRLKRGGGALHVPLDQAGDVAAPNAVAESVFDREWARSVLAISLESLRAACDAADKRIAYDVLVARDVDGSELPEPPTYQALAARFNVPVTQITNHLNWARARFRACVLDTLRSLSGSDAEFRAEARALLGVQLP